MIEELTLLDAAKALGITKNTVKYRLKKVPESMVRHGSDGRIYVSADALAMMRRPTDKPEENRTRTTQPPIDSAVSPSLDPYDKPSEEPRENGSPAPDLTETLQQTIDILREQLANKDKQIQALNEAIANAQALHAAYLKQGLLKDPDKEKSPDTQPQSFWQRIRGLFTD